MNSKVDEFSILFPRQGAKETMRRGKSFQFFNRQRKTKCEKRRQHFFSFHSDMFPMVFVFENCRFVVTTYGTHNTEKKSMKIFNTKILCILYLNETHVCAHHINSLSPTSTTTTTYTWFSSFFHTITLMIMIDDMYKRAFYGRLTILRDERKLRKRQAKRKKLNWKKYKRNREQNENRLFCRWPIFRCVGNATVMTTKVRSISIQKNGKKQRTQKKKSLLVRLICSSLVDHFSYHFCCRSKTFQWTFLIHLSITKIYTRNRESERENEREKMAKKRPKEANNKRNISLNRKERKL